MDRVVLLETEGCDCEREGEYGPSLALLSGRRGARRVLLLEASTLR